MIRYRLLFNNHVVLKEYKDYEIQDAIIDANIIFQVLKNIRVVDYNGYVIFDPGNAASSPLYYNHMEVNTGQRYIYALRNYRRPAWS